MMQASAWPATTAGVAVYAAKAVQPRDPPVEIVQCSFLDRHFYSRMVKASMHDIQ